MSTEPFEGMPTEKPADKPVKMISIMVQFLADTDEEAIAVKKAVNGALSNRPNTRVNFTIMDRLGSLP